MKITIYELLGMIKDGKAPKKIKHDGCNYFWNEYEKDYERTDINDYLFDNSIATDILNDEVQILETTLNTKDMNITSKKIEKIFYNITIENFSDIKYVEKYQTIINNIIADKINEIIDKLNGE